MFVFGARRRERVLMELFLILIFWTEIRRWIRKRERGRREGEKYDDWLAFSSSPPSLFYSLPR